MHIGWITAFIDQPADVFEQGTRFWQEVTGSGLSAFRGSKSQFATLLPPDGDPYLRVQRIHGDQPRVHIDFHVDSIADAGRQARSAGATLSADLGHLVMSSPSGLAFCLVSYDGESVRPVSAGDGHAHLVDQVCIDVPGHLFDEEAEFWHSLTGWELRPGSLDEFAFLARPSGLPIRLLLQRLGPDDPGEIARAHLDLACGDHVDDVAVVHERIGADVGNRFPFWMTMRDPVGLEYCLTARDQRTGLLPSSPAAGPDE
ncbi:MAG: VOC family protein [Actinomycetia bacterium]|nr:VOC family protein [Actinomycetes bacterium]MCP4226789.1 VOC family protein [Actinomycetes bacterium]MCP5032823.1 VOC family protein [Actinomycetes bacterium]